MFVFFLGGCLLGSQNNEANTLLRDGGLNKRRVDATETVA